MKVFPSLQQMDQRDHPNYAQSSLIYNCMVHDVLCMASENDVIVIKYHFFSPQNLSVPP